MPECYIVVVQNNDAIVICVRDGRNNDRPDQDWNPGPLSVYYSLPSLCFHHFLRNSYTFKIINRKLWAQTTDPETRHAVVSQNH